MLEAADQSWPSAARSCCSGWRPGLSRPSERAHDGRAEVTPARVPAHPPLVEITAALSTSRRSGRRILCRSSPATSASAALPSTAGRPGALSPSPDGGLCQVSGAVSRPAAACCCRSSSARPSATCATSGTPEALRTVEHISSFTLSHFLYYLAGPSSRWAWRHRSGCTGAGGGGFRFLLAGGRERRDDHEAAVRALLEAGTVRELLHLVLPRRRAGRRHDDARRGRARRRGVLRRADGP